MNKLAKVIIIIVVLMASLRCTAPLIHNSQYIEIYDSDGIAHMYFTNKLKVENFCMFHNRYETLKINN